VTKDLVLKHCHILTLDEFGKEYPDGGIWVSEGKIKKIGAWDKDFEMLLGNDFQKNYEIHDMSDRLVMPGLVNTHGHLSMSLFRNYADDMKLMDWLFNKIFPLEEKLDSKSATLGAELAMCEMIRTGTTTFSDMYFFMDSIAEVTGKSGLRAVLSRGLQGDDGNGMDYRLENKLDYRLENKLDYRLEENLALYKEYHNSFDGRIKVMLGPHSVYTCTPEYLKKIAKYSEKSGAAIQIHLSETKDEVSMTVDKYGKTPVELAYECGLLKPTTIVAHAVVLSDKDIEILAKNEVNISHNPGSNMKLASGICPVTRLIEEGINVSLGTDGASSNNNLDMFEEIRLATYIQKVSLGDPTALPVKDVLKMATSNGGKALGFNDIGILSEGMQADMVVLNTHKASWYPKFNMSSAIVYSASSADVESVIVRGKFLMKNKELLTIDEERVISEVEKWTKSI